MIYRDMTRHSLTAALLGLACVLVQSFDAPTLVVQTPTHQESITVRKGDSIRLQCRGIHPVTWSHPDAAIDGQEERLTINERFRRGGYISQLVLVNTTAIDTGFYGCRHELPGEVSDVSSLYIFVSDPNNLFVTPRTLQFAALGPNRTNIIPCRVTSPSVQVTLVKVNGEEEIKMSGDILFDPRIGFSLLYPNIFYNGQFKCRARLGVKMDIRRYILHYFSSTNVPKPHIIIGDAHHEVGSRLRLTCRTLISADTLMTVEWTKDGERIRNVDRVGLSRATKRIFEHEELTNGYSYAVVKQKVSIPCLQQTDSGEYRCTVTDHNGHTNSQSVNVVVEESGDSNTGNLCIQP